MAAQAIAGMVAIAASIGMGQSNYSEKKEASIGINAGCLVFVATKVADRRSAPWLSRALLGQQTQPERLALS